MNDKILSQWENVRQLFENRDTNRNGNVDVEKVKKFIQANKELFNYLLKK